MARNTTQRLGKDHPSWKGCGDIPKSYYTRILKHAKDRDLEVAVTIQDLWELYLGQNGRCSLTGQKIHFKSSDQSASLDRIDSSRGYVPGNIQWVLKHINVMKWHFSQIQFIRLCRLVAKNSGRARIHPALLTAFGISMRKPKTAIKEIQDG